MESMECRSRFCRLRVTHATSADHNQFLLDLFALDRKGPLFQTTGGFRAVSPTPTSDGRVLSDIYIADPGVSLTLDAS
jgi:hypothetical protein